MVEAWGERLQLLSVEIVPFIGAIVAHEYAHGLMAKSWGDDTAKDAGRLTLNPLPHLDPIGTLLPLASMLFGIPLLFGWARPVPIDPRRFRKYRPGLFWVALAGPGMNFILALVSAIALIAIKIWVPQDFYLSEPLSAMAMISIELNYALALFNLIPLPPLDGSNMVKSFLSFDASRKYDSLAKFSLLILVVMLFTGTLSWLEAPIEYFTRGTVYAVASVFEHGFALFGGAI
jgi:Zn-dependent protease